MYVVVCDVVDGVVGDVVCDVVGCVLGDGEGIGKVECLILCCLGVS